MNRSVLKLAVLGPLAVALTAAMMPAPAGADSGPPVAHLAKDAVEKTVPAQVADAAHPTVELPAAAVRGVFTTGRGLAKADPGGTARTVLGPGVLRTAHGEMSFKRMTARCENGGVDGIVRGATRIAEDAGLAEALPGVPGLPPANYRVPAPAAGDIKSIILNRQVRGAAKDLTVSAVSLVDKAGTTRDYGVARCGPVAEPNARHASPGPSVAGDLPGLILDPVMKAFVEPLSGMSDTVPVEQDPAAQGPAAQDPAQPRPASRAIPDPSGLLPKELAGTATGLTDQGGVAGGLTEPVTSAAGALGGAPGLPIVG